MPEAPDPTRFCDLARNEEPMCETEAVVAIKDRTGREVWGCETHARYALEAIEGARLSRFHDREAAQRLLDLPWNHRGDGLGL
jgi:hypothetical protein